MSAPAMPASLGAVDVGSLRLPARHFAAALLFLLSGSAGLVLVAPELAAGAFLSPRVAGVTHLFTLGWLTMTIFGALTQLLPVALGAPVRSPRLGQVGFWCYAPGALLFACGVFHGDTVLHHAGIALLATGIVLLVTNLALSLPRARERDATWWAVAVALAALTATLLLGVVLLHDLHTGFLREARVRTLAVHLHVALVGWVLVTMVGMSHRLLPMFLLAHGADGRWTRRALTLLAAGLVALAAGLVARWPGVAWVGLALLEAGVACFLVQCRAFYRARRRPTLDAGLRFAAVALGFLAASAALGPAVLALGGVRHPRLATAYVLVGVLGGVVLYVVGHFYKIVPFLAWIARFRGRVGRERVPTVAELYSARAARLQLALMTAGVAGMAGGVAVGSVALVRWAAVAFALGVVVLVAQAVDVVWGVHGASGARAASVAMPPATAAGPAVPTAPRAAAPAALRPTARQG
ncbi:MAG TPA: hypothetical protein VFS08_09560 [Gemmatimonadaceae bacterium]|nr:hypothetical protein [Gemmatimonadaceae bacterium]